MTTSGLPDWGAPVDGAGAPAWLVRGEPARAFTLPPALALQRDDGQPGYAIEAFRIASDTAVDMFGVLTMRFVGDYDLKRRQAVLHASLPGVRLEPLGLPAGYVRFLAANALDLSDLLAPQPLVSAGAGLKLTLRLSADGIRAFQQLTGTGAAAIRAQMIVAIPGLAARAPGRAKVDGDRLISHLIKSPAGWSRDALIEALTAQLFESAVQLILVGDPQADALARQALADRLLAAAFDLAAPKPTDAGPVWTLRSDSLAGRVISFDLNDETIASRAFLLESPALLEPKLNVREIAAEGGPIGLDTGFHLVTVDANLPPRRVGAAAIGIELTVPAAPPDRPQTINRTLRFDTAAALTSVPLRLGANEAPGFDYRTFVIAAIGGSAERLEGEVRHNDDDHLTIPQDAFAVDFVRAEATSALLSLGKVAIAWGGTRLGGTWRADVELTTAMPAVAVARPRDCENCVIRAQFIATDGSRTLEIPASPAGDLWLDLSNLVEFGPQSAELGVIFDKTRSPVAIEYAGEDATGDEAAITMVRIRPEEPKVDISWLPASPFRNGFRLRWVRPDGGRGDWSPIFSAGTAQILEAGRAATSDWDGSAGAPARDDSVDTTGLTLIATEPGSYVYRAASPRLAKNPDGRPALQFTAAGTAGFVQITAEFDVGPERLALLAEALKKRDGADPKLSPAADTISETQLLLDGKVVATGTASGIPPQTSLLSAMLDEAQAATIRKVMAGTPGLAIVRYTVDASDPVSDTSGFDQTTGDAAGSAAISSRSHSRQFHRHVIQTEADLANLIAG